MAETKKKAATKTVEAAPDLLAAIKEWKPVGPDGKALKRLVLGKGEG